MIFYTVWIGGELERETRDLEERQNEPISILSSQELGRGIPFSL